MTTAASSPLSDAAIEVRADVTWYDYYLASFQGASRHILTVQAAAGVAGALFLVGAAAMFHARDGGLSSFFASQGTRLILLGLGILVAWHVARVVTAARVVRRVNAAAGGARAGSYRFSSEGWSYGSGLGSSQSGWKLFEKVIETRRAFLLRQHTKIVIIVPKRGFASDEDVTRFRRILSERFGTIG